MNSLSLSKSMPKGGREPGEQQLRAGEHPIRTGAACDDRRPGCRINDAGLIWDLPSQAC